jgi:hypothetical protein
MLYIRRLSETSYGILMMGLWYISVMSFSRSRNFILRWQNILRSGNTEKFEGI